MPSERVQRRIDQLLDQAEEAVVALDWERVSETAEAVLVVDPENADAQAFTAMAARSLTNRKGMSRSTASDTTRTAPAESRTITAPDPSSFSSGRYTVSKFLGEGGKKKVYLAHDNTLDRDVAFALIKTEGLDETSRERVRREAQAMGRMGTHPCVMPIYDLGEENGQPYMVQPLMGGGDVEGLVEDAEGPLELDRAIEIATQTAQGLSFAHSKGIVHRDLKPGNVWLDEDGAAKIGDFGLAVATDRSRLTVEKVMVGTVSYMPPEQATGGEVTPQADLYSLGAMLYEMCTGRVPFMGDDDIGIISQHINTPPVAPSWHNSQIPKTLDSLILRLLAKDPSERPASADEVLAVLDAVDLTAVEEREEGSKGSLDSMADGVFVGRHREMDQLKAIFEDVLSGRGRMVTLVGEPGIGKTRTAQELATYAGMRGAEVLWGRSYESGGAPPYWPWVQAIRSHVAATEPLELRNQLGATAPVIAEVVSDVKTKLPDIPTPPVIEEPESARFRLFDSISTFLKQVASAKPLILMLEDLHWSDKPSLMLLEFVARELANSRILIVGNYRDMELNRRHPLSVTLGDLTRERLFERVVLRGLQRHDVERFVEIAAGITPPSALVDTVHSQTEGNPLFVTETVRLLIQEGDITSGQSSKGGTTSWEVRIPEGVREVIGRRLDRLSERCNEVLTTAAVMGRQFRFPVLLKLSDDVTENVLLDALDEALAARAIEELPDEVGFYQFTHALMQETLTAELSHTRSVRLHARIAEALEDYYGEEASEHAEELAEHFAEAETVLGTEKLVKYSLEAGQDALKSYATSDARRHLERAVSALADGQKDMTAGTVYFALSSAQTATMERPELQTAVDNQIRAYEIFNNIGQIEKALEVAAFPFPNVHGPTGLLGLIEKALPLAAVGSLIQGRLLVEHAQWVSIERGDYEASNRSFNGALEIAQNQGNRALEMRVQQCAGSIHMWFLQLDRALESSLRTIELAKEFNALDAEVNGRFLAVQMFLRKGDLDAAKHHARQSIEPARRLGNVFHVTSAMAANSSVAQTTGDFHSAMRFLEEGLTASPNEQRLLVQQAQINFMTGEIDLGRSIVDRAVNRANAAPNPAKDQLQLAIWMVSIELEGTGSSEHASLAEKWARQLLSLVNVEGLVHNAAENFLAKLAIATGDADLATETLNLEPKISGNELGVLSSIAGMNEKAIELLEEALLFARTSKYQPLYARTANYLADALIHRNVPGDREKAAELQDEAISIATELGMKPLLERVLAKREILKA